MKLLGTEAKGRGYCQFPLRRREVSTFALSKTRTRVGKLPPQQLVSWAIAQLSQIHDKTVLFLRNI
jgi:hypothetical protein